MATAVADTYPSNLPVEETVDIVSRASWKAQRGGSLSRLKHPVQYVRFVDTTTDADTYQDCAEYMREVQKFHMFTGDADIPYNFVIGPDHRVYQGIGWKKSVDRPFLMKYLEGDCIDIGFVGDHEEGFVPTSRMFNLAIDLILEGIRQDFISPAFRLLPMGKWRLSTDQR